jgi:hypothetical protein
MRKRRIKLLDNKYIMAYPIKINKGTYFSKAKLYNYIYFINY